MGLLDESFGTGNFEDDDFCLRATLAGYRNMIAGDVFIHHYGSRTFIGNKIDYGSTLSGHRKIFNEKWMISAGSDLGGKLLIASALEQADELGQAGETDKAVARLLEGIQQAPDNPESYRKMARILIDARRFQDGLDALKTISGAAQEDIALILLTGYAREGLGLDKEAEDCADAVLAQEPSRASALNLKGLLSYKRGDRPSAEAFFRRATEADPGYGEPYTNLGVMKWSVGDKEGGLALLEQGFILSPCIMDIATMYHAAIAEMNAFARAEQVFREARALNPQNQRVAFLLIDMLLRQGHDDAAMSAIENAMTVFTISDGLLAAALAVRKKVGAKEIKKSAKNKGALSLSMIVKNEENNIAKCLMSVRPIADEMIVVDTGSSDRTREIAKALGAQLYDFPWTGDFAAARNFSLSKASGEWVLSLDADEVVSERDHARLKELIRTGRPAAYSIITRNYTKQVGSQGFTTNSGAYPREEAGIGWFPSEKVRLFPKRQSICFENPVHEFVEGSVRKAGLPVKRVDIPVHHYGRLDTVRLAEKGEAYFQIGKKKLEEKGGADLKALFELGVQAAELKKFVEARALFEKLVRISPKYPLALFNLGFTYMSLGLYQEALETTRKAYELDPEYKECVINYAHCEILAGNINHGISLLEKVIKKAPDYAPALGVLSAGYYLGERKEEGLRILADLSRKGYNCTACLHDIALGLHALGRFKEAVAVIEEAVKSNNVRGDTQEILKKSYSAFMGDGGADS
jgi:tetratricopeptide (TPR) repeat protein